MVIGNFEIGTGRTLIIAELCSNIIRHSGEEIADAVNSLAKAGADAIKIQLFKADHFPEHERAYKSRVEFPRHVVPEMSRMCRAKGLLFGASVFDLEAVEICSSEADFIKIATREQCNASLLNASIETYLPVFRSLDITQNGWEEDIRMLDGIVDFACVPQYPAISFKIPWLGGMGWSSHTINWIDCTTAVSLDTVAVEKHVKLHHNDPEAGWSLYPHEFGQMVKDIRTVESYRSPE